MLCVLMFLEHHSARTEEQRRWPVIRVAVFGFAMVFGLWMWSSAASADEAAGADDSSHSTAAVESSTAVPSRSLFDDADADAEEADEATATGVAVSPLAPARPGIVAPVVDAALPAAITPMVQPLTTTLDAVLVPLVAPVQQTVVTPVVDGVVESVVAPIGEGVTSLVAETASLAQSHVPPAVVPDIPVATMELDDVDRSVEADRSGDADVLSAPWDLVGGRGRQVASWSPAGPTVGGEIDSFSGASAALPWAAPGAPSSDSVPRGLSPFGSSSPSRTGGGDSPDTTHRAVVNVRMVGPGASPMAVTPIRATIAGASKNSGSRPAFTPD